MYTFWSRALCTIGLFVAPITVVVADAPPSAAVNGTDSAAECRSAGGSGSDDCGGDTSELLQVHQSSKAVISLQENPDDDSQDWGQGLAAQWKKGKFSSVVSPAGTLVRCLVDGSCRNAPAAASAIADASIGMASALLGIAVAAKFPLVGLFIGPLMGGLLRGLMGLGAEPGEPPLTQQELDEAMDKLRRELRIYTRFAIGAHISNDIEAHLSVFATWYRRFTERFLFYGYEEADVPAIVANLDSICDAYERSFIFMENELRGCMEVIASNFDDFLATNSAVLSDLLHHLVPAVMSYQSALRIWWVTCSNHTKPPDGVHMYAMEYETTAGGHQRLLFRMYEAWESMFRQDLKIESRIGGCGAATSTPDAWDHECRSGFCTEPGFAIGNCGATSFFLAGEWSQSDLQQQVNCDRNPRWLLDGARTSEGNLRCYFPQVFTYKVCAPTLWLDDFCQSNESLRINILGLQARSYAVHRPRGNSRINRITCISTDLNPSSDVVKNVHRHLAIWAQNQAIAEMKAALAPSFFLSGPLYGPGADKFSAPSDAFKSVKIGPVSLMTSGHSWGSDPISHVGWSEANHQACDTNPSNPCQTVDVPSALNGACPTGIAGVATFFADELPGNPWARGIYGVGLYELNETSGLPEDNPCHALHWDPVLYQQGGQGAQNRLVTASLAPSASVYDLKIFRFRRMTRHPGTPSEVLSIVEFEFVLRDKVRGS